MVLVSILVCLLLLSILVASSLYLILSSVIVICIYLLLRRQLSDMSGNLFSMVIMPSPLISSMLIYIFLLLSIIIIFYNLFSIIHHISGKCYLFGWPQPKVFSQPSLLLSCSFAITRFSVLLSVWMISCSWFMPNGQVIGLAHFCVFYWFVLDYILTFPSLIVTSLIHCFFSHVSIFAS